MGRRSAVAALLSAARSGARPVAFTTLQYDAAGRQVARAFLATVPALSMLEPGTRWPQIDERIAPVAEIVALPPTRAGRAHHSGVPGGVGGRFAPENGTNFQIARSGTTGLGGHWLKGGHNGTMDSPLLRPWMHDDVAPAPHHAERPGRWVTETVSADGDPLSANVECHNEQALV